VYVKKYFSERWISVALMASIIFVVAALTFREYTNPPIAAVVGSQNVPVEATSTPPQLYPYLEVIDGCGPYYAGGVCVNMRSGPGTEYPVVAKLRTGMVLKIAETVARDGREWYKIEQDNEVRYPERITSDWYVAAEVVRLLQDDGDHRLARAVRETTVKNIIVDVSEEMLYAYNGNILFMQQPISTGLEFTPTPRGTFTVYKMTPSRFMQGPLPGVSDQEYDLPGVPWNLYFTKDGAVIHGAYWHDHFGEPWSHGCVNLPPDKAEELYVWAEVGMTVTVQD
jgi:lipoprotein-anchoring transpeptidase ErfK/SrfK